MPTTNATKMKQKCLTFISIFLLKPLLSQWVGLNRSRLWGRHRFCICNTTYISLFLPVRIQRKQKNYTSRISKLNGLVSLVTEVQFVWLQNITVLRLENLTTKKQKQPQWGHLRKQTLHETLIKQKCTYAIPSFLGIYFNSVIFSIIFWLLSFICLLLVWKTHQESSLPNENGW